MKDIIVRFRTFLLKLFQNKKAQNLIYAIISYEMVTYIFFGIFTSVVDVTVYSILTYANMNILIANVISSICAIIFAYVTNRLFVFKSITCGFWEIFFEFLKFCEARVATLIMSELILLICKLLHGNPYAAKIIAMILTVIINYILSKLFIFNSKKKGTKNDEEQDSAL